ncbi:class I SAM-dependent methyltransferase [Rhodanobacter soli]|uniref:class I SAM-dependent methyltransferase n=1 Tax=Rhodanobacter soli TaxID=590609 RepID=UPI0031D36941
MANIEESKRMHSGSYVESYEHKPITRIANLVALMNINGGELIADFACGNAMLLPLVAPMVTHYYGVDFSEDFITAAKRRAENHSIKNCSLYCQDIITFCNDHQNQFDIATALDFSEHIDNEDFLKIFSAIRKSLKSGGRLFLHTPNLDFFIERLKSKGILRQFPEHIAVRNTAQNVEMLEQCGFDKAKMRVQHIAHYNVLRVLHPLSALPVIGKLFAARLFIECEN